MRVALYLRRSTNEQLQHDSLRVQEEVLRAYAANHAMDVVEIYKDSASGTSTRHRTGFLRMAHDIASGAAFDAVLVRDVSRFGRFYDIDEGAFYEVLFLGRGVKTVYCEEVFGADTSPMAALLKNLRRVMAAEYSKERSRLVRYAQGYVARRGFRVCAEAPYGLRRVMVTSTGEHVRDLAPGETKALSSHRTSLALGEPEKVAVVRRIFEWFAYEKLGVEEITRRLNQEGVPAPYGGRWFGSPVSALLRNPNYCGTAVYRRLIDNGTKAGPDAAIEVPAAFEPLVTTEIWGRAQEMFARMVRHRSDDCLAAELRKAYELHGYVEKEMLTSIPDPCDWATYRTRFRRPSAALALAFAPEVGALERQLEEVLRASFEVTVSEGTWLLNRTLRVSFVPAFRLRWKGRSYWGVPALRANEDVVIGVGVGPQGLTTHPFVVQAGRLLMRKDRGVLVREEGLEALARDLEIPAGFIPLLLKLSRKAPGGVEEAFLGAARAEPLLSFAGLALRLNWPKHAVFRMYHRLRARGEWFPPHKTLRGRRVELVCDRCGLSRLLDIGEALRRRTSLCRKCAHSRPTKLLLVTCPDCGRESHQTPSTVRRYTKGVATRCRTCARRRRTR